MTAPLRALAMASASVFGLSAAASAATVTHSFTVAPAPTEIGGTASVPLFDPALGTLQSVVWSVTRTLAGSLTIINNGSAAQTGSAGSQVTFTLSNLAPALWDLGFSLATPVFVGTGPVTVAGGGGSAAFPIAASVTNSGAIPGDTLGSLALWTGPGSAAFDFVTTTQLSATFGGGNVSVLQATQAGLTFTVTYEYEPAVIPLPAAGWLLLSGIAGLGGLGCLRRRVA